MHSLFNGLLKSTHNIFIIILLAINCFNLFPSFTSAEFFAFVVQSFIIVYVIALLTRYHHKYERDSKYGEAMSAIGSGFAQIHHYNRLANDNKTNELQQIVLSNLCNSISSAFSILSGSNCSTSIKYLAVSPDTPDEIQIKTLCRDQGLGLTRTSVDKNKHLLKDNSDFKRIMETGGIGEGSFFIANQLPRILNYKNSSFEHCVFQPKAFGKNAFLNYFIGYLRSVKWPLPYRSCLIVPILPAKYDPNLKFEVLGFLCVDSNSIGTFRLHHDVKLLKGVADGIYRELDEYLS